jgi:hypothetical protein
MVAVAVGMAGEAMSGTRAKAVDDIVRLIREAMEKVGRLAETPEERIATDGIVVVLDGAIERIEALRDEQGD